ncbi:glycosyltransferase [Prosthecobacter algae]|uniref:glycosyltransferase family 4 protein n=1 Tax=Prosthecobacter algae TaxID=1144682 RepID=UPI0031EB3625
MRVVLAGTFGGQGGIQTHYYWLARALLEAGHEVHIVSLGVLLSSEDRDRVATLSALGKFKVFCPQAGPDNAPEGTLKTAWNLICQLRRIRPQVYVACGTGWNLFLPAILSGACPRRVFHEVMSGDSCGPRDSRHSIRFGFHQVVAQASPVARTFRRVFGWKAEVPVLPAFPEPLEVTATIPTVRRRQITAGLRAGFFSRLVPHKGALWLVRQWPVLADCLAELHIYGSGPEAEPIRDLIRENQWQDRVFCHGRYPDGQAYADLLSTFDLTLLPTLGAEGAPLVLLESMACGVPFVSYGVGGIPDYENPDCFIVDPGSPTTFLDAVKQAALRLTEGTLDQERLQQFYFEKFSYSRLAALWRSFIADDSQSISSIPSHSIKPEAAGSGQGLLSM